MTNINNSETIRQAIKASGLSLGIAPPNFSFGSTVQPTTEVNPQIVKPAQCVSAACNNATSATIISTPVNQDLYITGYAITLIKDATATSNATSVTFRQNGALLNLVQIPTLTLTAQTAYLAQSLTHPLQVDRGNSINIGNSTAVGNISVSVVLYYFVDESSKNN
jgi:hypothetical protein